MAAILDFFENLKTAENQPETDKKILTKWILKKWLPWQRLNWYGYNQHIIVFLDNIYEKSPNFVAVVHAS